VVDVIRTPDARFADLPDWDLEPTWVPASIGGLDVRLARHETGDPSGEPLVLFHGEPTWSYLYRHVMPPLAAAGHRVVAPDLVGFGRSDKPAERDWYTWDTILEGFDAHLEAVGPDPVTLVIHDWAGFVGLPWAVANPDRVARLVILDTAPYIPGRKPTEAWFAFRNFVERSDDLPIGFLVDGGCTRELSQAEKAAYEAPFPNAVSQAGPLALPLRVPLSDDDPGAMVSHEANMAMSDWATPTLILWGADDVILPSRVGQRWAERIPGCKGFEVLEGAHHFLQEDRGADIGNRIAAFMADNPV
jgi:haloalkane dehalogenase